MVPEENNLVVSPGRAGIVGVEDPVVVGLDVKLAQLSLLQRNCGEVAERSKGS